MEKFISPVLETERLILRPLTIDDADAAFEWTGDERVAKYMIYSTHENTDVTREWLSTVDTRQKDHTWGIVRKEDGKLIGSCGIKYHQDEDSWEFGYNIRFDCWNKGYTTEASRRMIEFVRTEHNAESFVAEHAVDNPASGRVIEKCGLHFVGFGEYSSYDGKKTFRSKKYEMKEGK